MCQESWGSICDRGSSLMVRPGFNPWVRKIPWRREQLPTPVYLPGEFHEQRSLVGYSPWSRKELDTTARLSLSLCDQDQGSLCDQVWGSVHEEFGGSTLDKCRGETGLPIHIRRAGAPWWRVGWTHCNSVWAQCAVELREDPSVIVKQSLSPSSPTLVALRSLGRVASPHELGFCFYPKEQAQVGCPSSQGGGLLPSGSPSVPLHNHS